MTDWTEGFAKYAYKKDIQAAMSNAESTTPATPEPPKPETPPPSGVIYRVQTGAFAQKANADRLAAEIKGKGFDNFVTLTGGLYKVQVGAYSVKSNAEAMLAKLKGAGYADAFITTNQTPTNQTPVQNTDNDAVIWAFFTSKGLNAYAVAGIMGNLHAESGLKPNNLQNSFEKSLNHTDESYTAAVDSGEYTNFVKDLAGYGLAQWTFHTRKQALLSFAHATGASIGSLTMQLEFMWRELQGYTGVMSVLNSAKSVLEASNVILTQYERPADQSTAVQTKRAEYGQSYFDKFTGKTTQPTSKTLDEIAREVIAGKWGNGQDRVQRLTAAGYDAKVVQARVNQLMK